MYSNFLISFLNGTRMSFKRRVVIFAFVSCFNFCISQLQQPPTQSNVQVDDLTALLPIVGTKFATFDIEVQPGDASESACPLA